MPKRKKDPEASQEWAKVVVDNVSSNETESDAEEDQLEDQAEDEHSSAEENTSVDESSADTASQEVPTFEDELDAELNDLIIEETNNDQNADSDDKLAQLIVERDQYLDASRRVQAEFENYRKQVSKRENEARSRANESLLMEILPVIDACDSAIANGSQDIEPVRASLLSVLGKQGLEKIDPINEAFDPEVHEAVMHDAGVASDDEPQVIEVLRVGYSLKGKVIRPAMVHVKG